MYDLHSLYDQFNQYAVEKAEDMAQRESMVTVPEREYLALRLMERIALGLLARYPFDSKRKMRPRWEALALALVETSRKKA